MPNDPRPTDDGRLIMHLEPLGLICGGAGTPLRETWVDLSSPNQVLYGLNGAGKTTVLESLHRALLGRAGKGRLLVRLPADDPNISGRLGDALSLMLTGKETAPWFAYAHEEFLGTQDEALEPEFDRRRARVDFDVPGSRFRELVWSDLMANLARANVWLFTPAGTDSARWTASPVLLVQPGDKWWEHLTELTLVLRHEDGPIAEELGLDLLWSDEAGEGAPVGIVGTLLERSTVREVWNPWWPFGQVVFDGMGDAPALTRKHLTAQPMSRWGSDERAIERGVELNARVLDLQGRANLVLAELLADAPALHLALGSDSDWFTGRSCTWTASRFEGDRPMELGRLSWAERRWASIAISLALADELNAAFDREHSELVGEDWSAADAVEGAATTWLLLDEPERGLHRTAETHMARGLGVRTGSGLRSILATHSPDLLDSGVGEVNYVRRRSSERLGAVISMRDFDGVREDLGLNPSDMLRRTRGIALVEGEHDLRILTGTIGADLARLGVELLPLRGGSQLRTATDSRFLYEFTDAVLFPILDDLMLRPVAELWTRHVAGARIKPASVVTEELRSDLRKLVGKGGEFLEEFLSTSITDGMFERVQPLGIPQTDILECLPVQAFVPKANSWEHVRDAARRGNGGVEPSETKFKQFLTKAHGADLSPENLERLARTSPVHPDVKALLAAIDARLSTQHVQRTRPLRLG